MWKNSKRLSATVTCVFGHGGLISVSLLLKDNVSKL